MGRGPDIKTVPVYEIMSFAPDGVCNQVPLTEDRGTLLAEVPLRGRGRYSLPNAWHRKVYFEEQQKTHDKGRS